MRIHCMRRPRVEQTHDMVAQRMVGPSQQRTTLADGARPSKSVASSHQGCAGSARDRKGCRGREREMGDGKKRQQRLARRLPPSHCKHCNSNTSSNSYGALAANLATEVAEKATIKLWSPTIASTNGIF